jgi:hypothetical protein
MNVLRKVLAAACLSWALVIPNVGVSDEPGYDLALVLAIDCSFSVDSSEFRLQMQGLGQALQDPDIWEAVQQGPKRRIAITAFQWSDNTNQMTIVPWTTIDNQQAAIALGQELEVMPRRLAEGGTSITNALLFAQTLLDSAPAATRRVVDVSTDGRNNIGPPLPTVRNRLVAQGITINALAIVNEFPNLDKYAEAQIIGGQSAFVVKAENYDDYGAAILRKLIKEITGPGTV